jgi:ribosomal protein L30/L7E
MMYANAQKQMLVDRDKTAELLRLERKEHLVLMNKLSESYGEALAVIRHNTEALTQHTEAFTELKVTLGRINSKHG